MSGSYLYEWLFGAFEKRAPEADSGVRESQNRRKGKWVKISQRQTLTFLYRFFPLFLTFPRPYWVSEDVIKCKKLLFQRPL